jgi:hypothetical protein
MATAHREYTYEELHEVGLDAILEDGVTLKVVPSESMGADIKACYLSSENLANLLRVDMNGPAEGAKAFLRVLILHGFIDEEQRVFLQKEIDAAFIGE